jgi:ABC-type Fe3+-hydroxamate transport system substrate-binding protein
MLALRNHHVIARRSYVLAAVLATGLALLASGCGERGEPVGAQADLYPITVTAADDRPFTIRTPAEHIAVLDRSAGAILVALGAGDRIFGAGIGAGRTVRVPGRPDLVVATSRTSDAVVARIAAAGTAVYVMPDTSIGEIERAITQLGLITAEPVAARRLIRGIRRDQLAVAARVLGRPRVSVFVDVGRFTTPSDQTLVGDLVREAGGRNVAPGGGSFAVKQLVELNPDVYIATTDSGVSLKTLRQRRATRGLGAVRRGRVVVVDSRLLEPGPAIGRGLEKLAEALHPGTSG